MITITVEHKYCGMVRRLEGESITSIYRAYGMSYQVWVVKEVEEK
jgi:hypothetical protein